MEGSFWAQLGEAPIPTSSLSWAHMKPSHGENRTGEDTLATMVLSRRRQQQPGSIHPASILLQEGNETGPVLICRSVEPKKQTKEDTGRKLPEL